MTAVPNALGDFAGDPSDVDAAPAADPSPVVDRLNGLLRGEIAAAETYRDVLERTAHGQHPERAGALRDVEAEHERSCQLLRARIGDLGGAAAESSGLWGVWAHTVQSTLSLIGGEIGGLRALREGEEHGQRDYETALNEVDAVTAQLIQDRLLPSQQRHLDALDQMLAADLTP